MSAGSSCFWLLAMPRAHSGRWKSLPVLILAATVSAGLWNSRAAPGAKGPPGLCWLADGMRWRKSKFLSRSGRGTATEWGPSLRQFRRGRSGGPRTFWSEGNSQMTLPKQPSPKAPASTMGGGVAGWWESWWRRRKNEQRSQAQSLMGDPGPPAMREWAGLLGI